MDSNTCFRPNPSVVWQLVDGQAVLVLPEQGQIKVLNQVGAEIWQLIDGQRTVADICLALQRSYEVPSTRLAQDMSTFLADLCERDIIRA